MNLWDGVKSALAPIAGVAANAIIPGSGGFVTGLLAKVLGCDNTPQALEEAIKGATPEQVITLKEMENRHEAALVQAALDNQRMFLQDVQDARQREVAVVKATGEKDVNLYVLAWVIMGGFLGLILALIYFQFSSGKVLQNDPLITLLLGSLATDAGMVVGYFFGSSKSSSDKNEILSQLSKRNITLPGGSDAGTDRSDNK